VSVLEGGYSDRALTSGTFAHICGLVSCDTDSIEVHEDWWCVDNLEKLEKGSKKRKGRSSLLEQGAGEPWLARCMEELWSLESETPKTPPVSAMVPSTMTLRERKPAKQSPSASPSHNKTMKQQQNRTITSTLPLEDTVDEAAQSSVTAVSASENAQLSTKKLPRVILRLGPRPDGEPS